MCNAGFDGPDGGPCAACEAGKYKAVNGSATCAFCAADTFSDTEAATACTQCFAHAVAPVGSTSLADCVCDVADGWSEYDDGGARACSQCAPGTYATAEGFETGAGCRNCSAGTFTHSFGQTVCDACAANTSSYTPPRDECECDAGYRCPGLRETCDKIETHLLASLGSKGKNRNPLACLRNAGFYSAESYCSTQFVSAHGTGWRSFQISPTGHTKSRHQLVTAPTPRESCLRPMIEVTLIGCVQGSTHNKRD